ncbi:hypothetical protein AB6A40_003215 [Gnathostoma spinigerum]|uniref:RCR-type E3 ubiquitin transferase n=1 Tax=Gnathostoma spinigerum TaxID=75299 RepID=A0ABD6EA55_9BILA
MSDNGERPEIANSGSLNGILRRPVLSFVTERHNLAHIRSAMSTAVARAVFFSHSFRVWNWLLKIVSVESSISDIIWQYLTALTSYAPLARWYTEDVTLATRLRLLPHPWRVCFIAGPVASRMVVQMHSFLHTVSVILKSGAVDPALRCLCFRAWTLQLTYHEQDMLSLICSVLSTVGRVLSDQSGEVSLQLDGSTPKSDTDLGDLAESESSSPSPVLKELVDLSNTLRIEATSRQAMVVCLTDGSGETFWESGEEDKNRSRSLTVHLQNESVSASLLALYIDNIRDEGHRITSVTVTTVDVNGAVKKLHSDALGYQFIGWTKCCLIGVSSVRVILKGPDQSSRLRQLRVFGFKAENDVLDDMEKREQISLRPSASHQLLFNYTQLDAFGLFQSIAAQAFGDEFSHEENGTLRQQILELLFSRVQLQSLQTYICSQMVNALEREVTNLRMKAKRNYSYACGLMVMLTKICGSRHGTDVFSVRNNLLLTLSELLLFAPQAVQFQAFETTERLIGLFSPSFVDCSKFIENLLVIIAKVISLQIRDKANHTVMTATLAVEVDDAPEYWRIDRLPTMDVGMLTKQFLSRLGDNCVDEKWMVVLRKEVAFHVMNLCQMNASDSLSSDRISTPNSASPLQSHLSSSRYTILKSKKFWLSVAALSILSDSFWLELSPIWQNMQDKKCNEPEHFCDNHDDGRTIAQVYCDVCECYLCHECFTVLHLNKRNRSHAVQLLGVSGKCPQIDIHEGCTRFRLSNLLILFHGSSLNGMVELTSNNSREFFLSSHSLKEEVSSVPSHTDQLLRRTSVHCRFCGNLLKQREQVHSGVCEHEECTRLAYFACSKVLLCGHPCCGIRNETDCLPCIICNNREVRQDADDLCVICFTDRLGGSPCIQLECGHIFHYLCVKAALEKKWIGPRILFRFMQCPLCRKQIEHPSLKELLEPMKALQADVASKARLRLEYDGLLQCPAITSENSEFHDDPEAYAMDRYVYVLCHKCGKPYFGGESRCQQALDSSQYNPEELLCGGCSNVSGSQVCGRHGVDYLEYKCRFCCSVAVYFCFGTSHFCAACHDDFQRLMCLPKQLLPKCPAGPRGIQLDGDCPLRVDHPATGEEFALGCGICRNLNTF